MLQTIKKSIASRKWWAAFIGAITPVAIGFLSDEVSLSETLVLSVGILGTYIFGQGLVDASAARNGS